MTIEDMQCAHACRNMCAMLNEALRQETATLRFYERLISQCDYPDVRSFVEGLAEERSRSILNIVQKLNEMHARSQILDGVISSFDPAGC
jgi:rubrerythrin